MSTFCLYFRALFGTFYLRLPFSSLVLVIWSFTVYFSGKRRSLLHPNTAQGSFFPLQSYFKKTLRKNVPKSARKYKRNVLMPPGHPIILLKSNSFSMAAVSVKRSIDVLNCLSLLLINEKRIFLEKPKA